MVADVSDPGSVPDAAAPVPDAGAHDAIAHDAAGPVTDGGPLAPDGAPSPDVAPTGAAPIVCPACGEPVVAGDQFCEDCGAELAGGVDTSPPIAEGEARTGYVAPPTGGGPAAEATSDRRTCPACGGTIAADGYCETCGTPAASERDHFAEQPSAWVAAVCDRGIRHHRNEDAVALCADEGPGTFAGLVVCDGVSNSTDSDVASLAAARAARDVLCTGRPTGGVAARLTAWSERLIEATKAANEQATAVARRAVTDVSVPTAEIVADPNPPSCTFVAGVVDGPLIVVGSVGDSRAYWLGDTGAAVALTRDDSWAAEQIARGVPRAVAEQDKQAHSITRWLGIDAPDVTPTIQSWQPDGPGWLLVCSDGLWNYCSEAADLAALVQSFAPPGADPVAVASALVTWANAQGGQDNITAALARLDRVGAT
jgi:serine/threonine protein phosphatase PrpC